MMRAVVRRVVSSYRASTSAASPCLHCKKVFVDMPNALSRSNIHCRGSSIAALLPSESTGPSKGRKRIAKHERRAMVESFVDKYRAINSGKFPSVSLTQKEIGGSYYVIREIIQELEYKFKFPPMKEMVEFPLEELKEDSTSSDARKEPSVTGTEEASISVPSENSSYHEKSVEFSSSFGKGIMNDANTDKAPANDTKAQESSFISSNGEETCDESSVNVNKTKGLPSVSFYDAENLTAKAVKSAPSNDPVKQILEGAEKSGLYVDGDNGSHGTRVLHDTSTTEVAVSSLKDSDVESDDFMGSVGSHSAQAKADIREDMLKSFPGESDGSRDMNDLKQAEKKGSQQFSGNEDLHRVTTREHEEASQNESTVWESLKSLAHGIINFWKKM